MSNVLDLLSPDNDSNYFRVKQATKIGYILCEWGGAPTFLIRPLNYAEAEYKKTVR